GIVELLEIRCELASKAEEKIALLYSIAGIHHRELGDAARAEEFYRKILEIDPVEEGAYRSLENICREAGDEQGIAAILEKEVKALEGLPQANEDAGNRIETLRMRLAHIYCGDPGTFENAFGIVKKVLKTRGADEGLIPIIERIWDGGKGLFEAVYLLIDIYKKTRHLENLHRVYSEGISASLDMDLKRGFLNEAEKLAEKLGDKKSLMEHRKALINLDPSDEKLYALLLGAAKSEEEYLNLASFFSGLFKECGEDETGLKIGKLLGNLHAQNLAQPETAADYYRLVFLRDSGDLETREALISIYIATQKWFDLALLYEQLSEIVPQNSEKLLYLFKASAIYGEKLSDTEKRAEINQKVLEIDPANTTAVSELENYYRETGDYKNLIEILRKRFAFSEGEAVKGILLEIADIYSERLQEYDSAASALKEAMDIDPEFKPAVEKLEHIYAVQKDFEELAKFYGIRLSYAAGVPEKVELLTKISQLNEFYLNNPEGAEKSLREITALDSRNIFALTRLDDLYASRKDYENLLEILKLRLSAAANRIEELSFLIRLGSICQKLSKFRDALDVYRKI
ncbi:MAG: hypothetical protein FJ088_10815, partial [Deltaproteobacteria bacterium]|nr:hypothetical protein [Deltaproteobacteria bacterium]